MDKIFTLCIDDNKSSIASHLEQISWAHVSLGIRLKEP